MEKDADGQNYQPSHSRPADLGPPPVDYSELVTDRHSLHHPQQEMVRPVSHEGDPTHVNSYMFHQQSQNGHPAQAPSTVAPPPGLPQMDTMISFADVMQFADFGPRLGLTPKPGGGVAMTAAVQEEMEGCFLRFPVLPGDDVVDGSDPTEQERVAMPPPTMLAVAVASSDNDFGESHEAGSADRGMRGREEGGGEALFSVQDCQQVHKMSAAVEAKSSTNTTNGNGSGSSNRRKRPRAMKTSEEVESQRMTHIAVERNRRKQMNEHLRVLRSLMPGSYVQRGDQASIIGGAIEFVRELEQLLQCLESQKRRRLFGEGAPLLAPPAMPPPPQLPPPPPATTSFLPLPPPPAQDLLPIGCTADDAMKQLLELEGGDCREETAAATAESKSGAADVEVKVVGLDAVIKVLSRRRTGQLLKTIAALEEMRFDVMHTNVTTIDQTVLYSFHVKIASETRFSAEEIASSVQHMFGLFDANAL